LCGCQVHLVKASTAQHHQAHTQGVQALQHLAVQVVIDKHTHGVGAGSGGHGAGIQPRFQKTKGVAAKAMGALQRLAVIKAGAVDGDMHGGLLHFL
jgi:hypothetical protein